jgi:hypothetical protein
MDSGYMTYWNERNRVFAVYHFSNFLDNKTLSNGRRESRFLIFRDSEQYWFGYCMIRAFSVAQTTFTAAIFLS